MASEVEQTHLASDSHALFEQLERYPWESDEEFKSGLSAILGSNATPDQSQDLTLRARTFYFARKFNTNVDFDAYKAWKARNQSQEATQTVASKDDDTAPKLSYQEIVDLIQSGKPIPGIKEIPNTILEGQGTTAAKSARRKPWEKDEPIASPAEPIEASTDAV